MSISLSVKRECAMPPARAVCGLRGTALSGDRGAQGTAVVRAGSQEGSRSGAWGHWGACFPYRPDCVGAHGDS